MFPKLLNDLRKENSLQLNSILSSGLPWLKLDITCPKFTPQVLAAAVEESTDWREQWNVSGEHYHTKSWNGKILFGPTDWNAWLNRVSSEMKNHDEDGLCKKYRHTTEFSWNIDPDHPVRQWVNSFLDDNSINIVNYYLLPPGGYLHPHFDPCIDNKWLNKIYAAIAWPQGSEFGFLDWGNAPINEGDVFLINNYQYPHWVLNSGTTDRIVLDIGCDLNSIQELVKRSFLQR
jgi:hypothetical protein